MNKPPLCDLIWAAIHDYVATRRRSTEAKEKLIIIMGNRTYYKLIGQLAEAESIWIDDLKYHADRPDTPKIYGAKVFVAKHLPDDTFYVGSANKHDANSGTWLGEETIS